MDDVNRFPDWSQYCDEPTEPAPPVEMPIVLFVQVFWCGLLLGLIAGGVVGYFAAQP